MPPPDLGGPVFDGNAPAHQWQVRSSLRVGRRLEIDAAFVRTSALRTLAVPGFSRAEARAEFELTPQVALIAAGRNLFTSTHAAFASPSIATAR